MTNEEEAVKDAGYEDETTGNDENSLVVVGEDGENTEGDYEYSDVRQQILSVLETTEDKTWELAIILETAYEGAMYRSWGFESWKDYVDKELHLHIRKAQMLVRIQEKFKLLSTEVQAWLRDLGWTKARMLVGIVTMENAAEWKNLVQGKTVAEIEKMLKEAGDEGGEEGEPGESPEDTFKKVTLSLAQPQYDNYKRAIDKAEEISGSDKAGNLVDLICTEFLTLNAPVETLQEYFIHIERSTGVKLMAYKEDTGTFVYGQDLIDRLEQEAQELDGDDNSEENPDGEEVEE